MKTGIRVLVCGGRNFTDRERIWRELDSLRALRPIEAIVTGCARGADTLAMQWALKRGITAIPFPADWKTHGRKAGPLRNAQMLKEGRPDVVLAFPGGKGTADMIGKAMAEPTTAYSSRTIVIFAER